LNNSPQISAAAATDGRPLTRYAANTCTNGTADNSVQESLENLVRESLEDSAEESLESTRKERLKRKSEGLTVGRRA